MPMLSLCMIVKNEERFLGLCLKSVKNLVDEIIIVDTGSTDATKEIAQEFTDKVFDVPWTDDFAAARNESLKHATGDWILVLDADEVLSPEDALAIRAALAEKDAAGYWIMTKNYGDDSSIMGWQPCTERDFSSCSGWFPSLKIRLFRRDERVRFEGAVHEMVSLTALSHVGVVKPLRAYVHHLGAMVGDAWEKRQRYAALSLKKLEGDSQNAKTYFELGIQYKELGELPSAEAMLQKAVELDGAALTPLLNLALVLQKQGKLEQAEGWYTKVLEQQEGNAEALFGLGFCAFRRKELPKAEEYYRKACEQNPRFLDAFVNLGAVQEKTGRFTEALETYKRALQLHPAHGRTYYNIGVVHEKMLNIGMALKCYEKAAELGYKKEELKERMEKMKGVLGMTEQPQ